MVASNQGRQHPSARKLYLNSRYSSMKNRTMEMMNHEFKFLTDAQFK
jgi:hypothetical protein